MRAREKCNEACTGCVHDGHKWVSMSPTCEAEFVERHELAHAEHLARQPDGTYIDDPRPVETVNHVTPPASTGA